MFHYMIHIYLQIQMQIINILNKLILMIHKIIFILEDQLVQLINKNTFLLDYVI